MLLEAGYRIPGEMLLNRTFFSLQSITFRKILTQVIQFHMKNLSNPLLCEIMDLISVFHNPNIRNVIVCV